MNKKEANEIKKLFTPAGCAITRICGCYAVSYTHLDVYKRQVICRNDLVVELLQYRVIL